MWGFWLLIILLLLFLAALPTYPYSRQWGYYPSGVAAAGVIALLLMIWFGVFVFAWPWTPAVPR